MPIDTQFPVATRDDQITDTGEGMAARVTAAAVLVEPPDSDDAAAAGDWGLFRRRCGYVSGNRGIDSAAAIALKRRFCLSYLGGRAQVQGGVYMRTRPSVFTPVFVEGMAAENAARRYQRYPWLEKLIALQQQLDQDQYRTPAPESEPPAARRHLHMVPTTNGRA